MIAAVLLIPPLALAVTWGVADVFRSRAELILDLRGDRFGGVPSRQQVARALVAYSIAHAIDPMRPDFTASLADMYALLADRTPGATADTVQYRRLARDYYRAAIARRPSWPYAWANLAITKFRLAELDDEFRTALERAASLGPWEAPIQVAVADMGLAAWAVLPEDLRGRVRDTLARGLTRQGETMVELARRHRRSDVIEPLVRGDDRLKTLLDSPPAGRGGAR